MIDLSDIKEVWECKENVANRLLDNGWVLLNTYTYANGENDLSMRYSLGRPSSVTYTGQQAEDACYPIKEFKIEE